MKCSPRGLFASGAVLFSAAAAAMLIVREREACDAVYSKNTGDEWGSMTRRLGLRSSGAI